MLLFIMLHKVVPPFVLTYKIFFFSNMAMDEFPGIDLVRTLFEFKKRKENLSSYVQSRRL